VTHANTHARITRIKAPRAAPVSRRRLLRLYGPAAFNFNRYAIIVRVGPGEISPAEREDGWCPPYTNRPPTVPGARYPVSRCIDGFRATITSGSTGRDENVVLDYARVPPCPLLLRRGRAWLTTAPFTAALETNYPREHRASNGVAGLWWGGEGWKWDDGGVSSSRARACIHCIHIDSAVTNGTFTVRRRFWGKRRGAR